MHRRFFPAAVLALCAVALNAQFATTPEQVREHVEYLASDELLGRGFGTPQGLKAARYIAGQFESAGVEPLGDSYLHPFNYRRGILNIPGNNVVGVITGNDPDLKNEYIVLGAHYDHLGWKIEDGDTVVYNGADDNATGSSSIIEIGRNLVKHRDKLKRSVILVAFDGEESGLIGSGRFVSDEIVPPHRIKLMFSLDMVGMVEKHEGLDLKGVKMLNDYEFLTGELATKYGLKITKANKSTEQRTDTAPFGKIGIPAVAVFTGTESPYHKPEDTAEKLDYEGMASVVNFMSDATTFLSSTLEISGMKGPEEGGSPEKGPGVFRVGILAKAGSGNHHYRDQFYDGKSIFAASGGIFASLRISDGIYLVPEVIYESMGSMHTDGVFRTHSLTTPLNFQVGTHEDFVRTYFIVGAYYSYHFGGEIAGTAIDFQNDYQNQEFGLSFGFGFEFKHKVQYGLHFQKGLTDINQQPDNKMTHNTVCFSFGYIF